MAEGQVIIEDNGGLGNKGGTVSIRAGERMDELIQGRCHRVPSAQLDSITVTLGSASITTDSPSDVLVAGIETLAAGTKITTMRVRNQAGRVEVSASEGLPAEDPTQDIPVYGTQNPAQISMIKIDTHTIMTSGLTKVTLSYSPAT